MPTSDGEAIAGSDRRDDFPMVSWRRWADSWRMAPRSRENTVYQRSWVWSTPLGWSARGSASA